MCLKIFFYRYCSSDTKFVPRAIKATAASKDEAREFMGIFPDLVRSITDSIGHNDGPELARWCTKVARQNNNIFAYCTLLKFIYYFKAFF